MARKLERQGYTLTVANTAEGQPCAWTAKVPPKKVAIRPLVSRHTGRSGFAAKRPQI
jgi:hypothetical protein